MSYKYSKGERELGDIEYEDDPGTKINFEQDYVSFETSGNPVLTVSGSKVGIGTVTPNEVLQVAGNLKVAGNDPRLKIDGNVDSHPGLELYENGARKWIVFNNYTNDNLNFKTNSNTRMSITQAGNVGIGTQNPTSALDVDAISIRIRNSGAPSSASDTGAQGEIRWDANYLYICVATNTWKRVALSAW